jgi:hypothetical protein
MAAFSGLGLPSSRSHAMPLAQPKLFCNSGLISEVVGLIHDTIEGPHSSSLPAGSYSQTDRQVRLTRPASPRRMTGSLRLK